MATPMPQTRAMRDVLCERERQDTLWGVQNHADGTGLMGDVERCEDAKLRADFACRTGLLSFRDILHEEVCEAFAEVDAVKLRDELVQVAAVAVAWVEAIDRRACRSTVSGAQ